MPEAIEAHDPMIAHPEPGQAVRVTSPFTGQQIGDDRSTFRSLTGQNSPEGEPEAWIEIRPSFRPGLEFDLASYPLSWIEGIEEPAPSPADASVAAWAAATGQEPEAVSMVAAPELELIGWWQLAPTFDGGSWEIRCTFRTDEPGGPEGQPSSGRGPAGEHGRGDRLNSCVRTIGSARRQALPAGLEALERWIERQGWKLGEEIEQAASRKMARGTLYAPKAAS